MRRLHILGSSHAARILKAVTRNKCLTDTFLVSGTVRPGAKLADLNFPTQMLATFNEADILIIQLFGNELIKRNIKINHKMPKNHSFNSFCTGAAVENPEDI